MAERRAGNSRLVYNKETKMIDTVRSSRTTPAGASGNIVARLRDILNRAGDERWVVEPDDRRGMEYSNHIVLAEDTPKRQHKWPGCSIAFMAHDGPHNQKEFDAKAELIAESRNALPVLIDEIERLRSADEATVELLKSCLYVLVAARNGQSWSTNMLKDFMHCIVGIRAALAARTET